MEKLGYVLPQFCYVLFQGYSNVVFILFLYLISKLLRFWEEWYTKCMGKFNLSVLVRDKSV